jgi:hypothetical protein
MHGWTRELTRGWIMTGVAWLAVTGALVAAPVLLWPELARLRGPSTDLTTPLRGICALVLVASLAWWWASATAVLAGAARGRLARPRGCPRVLHRLLLTCLGVGLVGGLGAPAVADGAPLSPGSAPAVSSVQRLVGLPYPDRAETPVRPQRTRTPSAPIRPAMQEPVLPDLPAPLRRHVVRPGDTLWALATHDLPDGASDAQIAFQCLLIYRANRAVIGDDPDLLLPGTTLRLPPSVREEIR